MDMNTHIHTQLRHIEGLPQTTNSCVEENDDDNENKNNQDE